MASLPPPARSPGRVVDESAGRHATYVSVDYVQQRWILQAAHLSLLAPLDRVKYVMLTQRELQRLGRLQTDFRTSLACTRHLTQNEGVFSMWRGNTIQVVGLLPSLLAQLFIAPPTQSFLFRALATDSATGYWAAGYAASLGGAVAASLVSYPLDYARFRLAVDLLPGADKPYAIRNSLSFFAHPTFLESPHLLYTGLGVYVVGSVIYRAVHGALFALLGPLMPPDRGDGAWRPILIQTTCGLSVASAATVCLHPLDVIRHRMMLAVTQRRTRYTSAMQCLHRVYNTEGVRGLYRGWVITLARLIISTELMLLF